MTRYLNQVVRLGPKHLYLLSSFLKVRDAESLGKAPHAGPALTLGSVSH